MKTRYKKIDLHIYDNILAAAYLQQLLNSMLKVDEVSLPANCTTAKMLAALVRTGMV